MKLTKLFSEFFESEKAGGLLLIVCTAVSLLIANSFYMNEYTAVWNFQIGGHSLTHWINDGLMAVFFLLIGLELERELYSGELSNFKNALLPIVAAIGGVLVPAVIYIFINLGSATQAGFGIPMATDIAFALGVLSLAGSRVPLSLKIFLTALAVIDDLIAIIVIAVFYSGDLSLSNLFLALTIWSVLIFLNRRRVYNLIPYIVGGIAMWFFVLNSGIHASISGVMLAFAIPRSKNEKNSPSDVLEHKLQKAVAFIILPLFALANTGIVIGSDWYQSLGNTNSLGIILGLVLGKPIGIIFFSMLAIYFGLASLPEGVIWRQFVGVGVLGGIGFTMSIFITLLAFNQPELIAQSKIAVIIASLFSGLAGYGLLKTTTKKIRVTSVPDAIE